MRCSPKPGLFSPPYQSATYEQGSVLLTRTVKGEWQKHLQLHSHCMWKSLYFSKMRNVSDSLGLTLIAQGQLHISCWSDYPLYDH